LYIWLGLFGFIYILSLGFSSFLAKKDFQIDIKNFVLGGSNLTAFLGVLTFSATLFSAFTLMGMPDFVRTHGVGAWIFLGVTDVAMVFLIVLLGTKTRARFQESGHISVGCFLRDSYQSPLAALVFLGATFVFLVPYTAIQIKGVALFLDSTIPLNFGYRFWAVSMLAVILTYTTVGGFKAIVYSDVIQGTIILVVTWMLAMTCLGDAGGVENLFLSVKKVQSELLSVPGPQGLFTTQFLLSAFLSIIVMPLSQPSLTTRIIAMKDKRSLNVMSPLIGFFAFAVILPAIFLGMYGAIHYSDLSSEQFWSKILVNDQPGFLGALTIIAILAAAMSTTDSQLFALSNEANLFLNKQKYSQLKTKSLIFLFSTTSLLFALFSSGNIVSLASLSFTGTAMLVPMFVIAVLKKKEIKYGHFMPLVTAASLGVYTYFTMYYNEDHMIGGLRLDLLLFALLTLSALGTYFLTPILRSTRD
jgi:SSS family solute:Na+ symporter